MKTKRRRLASVEAAIVRLADPAPPRFRVCPCGDGFPHAPDAHCSTAPASQPPLVEPPRCTRTPPCSWCAYCRAATDGPDWWQWPRIYRVLP